jgi:hypothetical protein
MVRREALYRIPCLTGRNLVGCSWGMLEQLAQLDLRRPLGLEGLAKPDLTARQRIGPRNQDRNR